MWRNYYRCKSCPMKQITAETKTADELREHALQASLAQFFEVCPPAKRFEISDDAWQLIDAFAMDRSFVYATTDFRSRVNLVSSVLHGSSMNNHSRIQQLIEQLTELPPWSRGHEPTARSYARGSIRNARNAGPSVHEFSRVLVLAYSASIPTLIKFLDVLGKKTPISQWCSLIIPALVWFVGQLSPRDRTPLVPTLRSHHETMQSALSLLRNTRYAACFIPDHCSTCRKLQAFLVSPAAQISRRLRDETQLKHILTVKSSMMRADALSLRLAPPNLVLTKANFETDDVMAAEQCLASLASLLS